MFSARLTPLIRLAAIRLHHEGYFSTISARDKSSGAFP